MRSSTATLPGSTSWRDHLVRRRHLWIVDADAAFDRIVQVVTDADDQLFVVIVVEVDRPDGVAPLQLLVEDVPLPEPLAGRGAGRIGRRIDDHLMAVPGLDRGDVLLATGELAELDLAGVLCWGWFLDCPCPGAFAATCRPAWRSSRCTPSKLTSRMSGLPSPLKSVTWKLCVTWTSSQITSGFHGPLVGSAGI